MPAGRYDFTDDQICEQGATLRRVFTLTDSDDAPIDLTGYEARMQVRQGKENEDTVLEITSDSELVIDPLVGKITLTVDAETTAAIAKGSYVYDLEIIAPGSDPREVTRLLYGKFKVSREVTR